MLKTHFNFRGLGITLATALGTIAAGLYFGEMAVRELTFRMAKTHLVQYAAQLVAEDENISAELRTALTAVDASEHAPCSASDIGYFRALIFESDLLRDAGRFRAGAIQCSAALGAPARPAALGPPAFIQQDGTEVYKNVAVYPDHDVNTIMLVRGGSYVVFIPETRLHLETAPLHYAFVSTNAPTQKHGLLIGEPLGLNPELFTQDGLRRQGDRIFATRCSIRYFDCVTTSTSMDELIAVNRNVYNLGIAFSGVLCGMIGFVFFSFYVNNKRLDQQLRRAIRDGRIGVVYQPIVEQATGRMAGAEALARWTDESHVGVSPDVFVRIAEERGFIGDLTRLVVQRVLRDCGELLRSRTDFRVNINITAADLADARFLPMLDKSCTAARVHASRLVLEITESSTVRNQQAIEAIRTLRERGHSVHIDDFGTGYSSLAYLHDLAVDALKIDRVFTQSIGTESVTSSILPQILAMARALHLAVIVEGVETLEQAEYFQDADLPVYLQGWYFGKPQPFWQLLGLLAEGPRRIAAEREAGAPTIHAA